MTQAPKLQKKPRVARFQALIGFIRHVFGSLWHLVTIEFSAGTFRRYRRLMSRRWLVARLVSAVHLRRSRLRLRMYVAKLRIFPPLLVFALTVLAVGSVLVVHNRTRWGKAAAYLADKGVLQAVEIAIGAAILGVIGIVFSLAIFSIQQVAERGTALTLREYARDWLLRVVYWTLAGFALVAMLSALQRTTLGLYGICVGLGMLVASVVLLRVYFDRAMKFADPHFTITKVASRAKKSLRQIERVEQAVRAEVRYQRMKAAK